MSSDAMLDAGAAREAASALELSAATVARYADRLDSGGFGPDTAGRNYRPAAIALTDGLTRLSTGLRAWSSATDATSSAIRASVTATMAVDVSSARATEGVG